MIFRNPFAKKRQSHIDCELFDERFEDAKRYLDLCEYRVDSTDLPRRFILHWQMPVARNRRERRELRALFESNEPGVLIQLPLAVYDYAWRMRYDRNEAPDAGQLDEAELLRRLEEDPRLRAEIEYFNARFSQFQHLIRYIFTMTMIRRRDRMRRFDLFDVDAYDDVFARIDEDGAAGDFPTYPVIF